MKVPSLALFFAALPQELPLWVKGSLTSWYLVPLGSGEEEATSAGRARFCMAPLPPFLSLWASISPMSSTQLLLNASVASSWPWVQNAKIFWAPLAGGLCVRNLGPWKLISFDYPLFYCSWNMFNYKGWGQEWCNSYGAINQCSHCEYPGGKL